MPVSVDYDETLSEDEVQVYIKSVIARGITVYICTRRYETSWLHPNHDLLRDAKKLGIPEKRIIFTGMNFKYNALRDLGVTWHLDNDINELKFIAHQTDKIKCIQYIPGGKWMGYCEKFLKKNG